jgi:hypothetical protein
MTEEAMVQEKAALCDEVSTIAALGDLHLALVGGGIGDTIL